MRFSLRASQSPGQRIGRTLLTVFAAAFGIAAIVAAAGFGVTSAGQVSNAFTRLSAQAVTVTDVGTRGHKSTSFPADAEKRIDALNGVISSGISWQLPLSDVPNVATTLDPRTKTVKVPVRAASLGYLEAVGARFVSGVPFSDSSMTGVRRSS